MAITLINKSTSGSTDGIGGTYNPGSEEPELAINVTVASGSKRLLYASAHSRGNAGQAVIKWVRIYENYVNYTNRGTLKASLTEIVDIHADQIIHSAYWALLEGDMPSNGTYKLVVNAYTPPNLGAFQLALGYALFAGVMQTYTPLTATEYYPPGTIGDIDQSIVVPGPGLIVDNWSGDGNFGPKTESDQTRTANFLNRGPLGDLSAHAAYTIVTSGGTYTFGYTSQNHNRDALGIVFWGPSAPPSSAPRVNTYQWSQGH